MNIIKLCYNVLEGGIIMKNKVKSFLQAIAYMLLAGAVHMGVGVIFGVGIVFWGVFTKAGLSRDITSSITLLMPYILIASSIGTIFLFWMVYLGQRKKLMEEVHFKSIQFRHAAIAVGLGIAVWCINGAAVNAASILGLFSESLKALAEFSQELLSQNIFLALLATGIIVPISEEVLFRGVIYETLHKNFSAKSAIIIQAIFFGIFHLNLIQGIYAAFFGIILGYAYYRVKSIWAPIIMHMINNIVATIIAVVVKQNITLEICLISFGIGLIGLVLFVALLMKHTYSPNEQQIVDEGEMLL